MIPAAIFLAGALLVMRADVHRRAAAHDRPLVALGRVHRRIVAATR